MFRRISLVFMCAWCLLAGCFGVAAEAAYYSSSQTVVADDTDIPDPLLVSGPGGSVLTAYAGRVRSRNAAGHWSASQDFCFDIYCDLDIAQDAQGNAVIAWYAFGVSHINIRVKPAGGVWSSTQSYTLNSLSQPKPSVAIANGHIVVAWVDTESDSDHAKVAVATRNIGSSWSAASWISAEGVSNPVQAAVDKTGNAVVVWHAGSASGAISSASRMAGGSWDLPFTISPADPDALTWTDENSDLDLAASSNGRFRVVWKHANVSSGIVSGFSLLGRTYTATGGWNRIVAIDNTEVEDLHMTMNASGYAVVVYTSASESAMKEAWSLGANSSFSTPRKITNSGVSGFDVAVDDAGDAYVVWMRSVGAADGWIQEAHRSAHGSWSADASVASLVDLGFYTRPIITSEARNRATIVWEQSGIRTSRHFCPSGNSFYVSCSQRSGGGYLIQGTSGSDTLRGTSRADVLYGNGGDDLLNGAAGRDSLFGGAGDDRLSAGDGIRDHALNCGAGDDRIFIDALDDAIRSCERRRRV